MTIIMLGDVSGDCRFWKFKQGRKLSTHTE